MSIPYEGDSTTKDQPGIKGFNNAGGDGVQGFGTLNGPHSAPMEPHAFGFRPQAKAPEGQKRF
jgi:hypothetical protein